jgi:hypothetical protein
MSFAIITLCGASQQVFITVVYFVINIFLRIDRKSPCHVSLSE